MIEKIFTRQVDLNYANVFYKRHHRHLGEVQGHKMSFCLTADKSWPTNHFDYDFFGDATRDHLFGMLTIGRPVGRFADKSIAEITRICFHKNLKLRGSETKWERTFPSWFVKSALILFKEKNPEFHSCVTYIAENESGKFLEHAGFVCDKTIPARKHGWEMRRKDICYTDNWLTEEYARKFKAKLFRRHRKSRHAKKRLVVSLT